MAAVVTNLVQSQGDRSVVASAQARGDIAGGSSANAQPNVSVEGPQGEGQCHPSTGISSGVQGRASGGNVGRVSQFSIPQVPPDTGNSGVGGSLADGVQRVGFSDNWGRRWDFFFFFTIGYKRENMEG